MTLRLALPFLLALSGPALALDLTAMTEDEKVAFGEAVRSYLIENPTVLIEVITILEQQESAAAQAADLALARAHLDDLHNDGHSWVGGNPDGDITLVEFMDYRCGYCRRAYSEVAALLETDGNIRFIVKELPILGPESLAAAQFAVAVQQIHGDELYEAVHDTLMTIDSSIDEAALRRVATAFDLPADPILAAMNSPAVQDVLSANRALADALQITGTPTFVMEDRMVRGYVPLAQMQALAADLRQAE